MYVPTYLLCNINQDHRTGVINAKKLIKPRQIIVVVVVYLPNWSDSKGSVINANDTPSFPFVYVIISVSCGTSLSTLTVESHPSFMSIFYLLSTGPREIYCYDSFK